MDKNEPQLTEKVRIEFKNHYEIRGYFLDYFGMLEARIDMYLSHHFFPNNSHRSFELRTILIDRLTFEAKRKALEWLLVAKRNAVPDNNKGSKKNKMYNKLLEDIAELGRIRNQFAHYPIVFPVANNKYLVTLIENRDIFKSIEYTPKQFAAFIDNITLCVKEIDKIVRE